jgi:hypothetical protein
MPLFGVREDNYLEVFLGTSTFVGRPPILVTANHVLDNWTGPYDILVATPETHKFLRTKLIHRRKDIDIALLEVPEYPIDEGIILATDEEIVNNKFVLCCEYSQTILRKKERELEVFPTTRMGNVTKFCYLEEIYGKAGDLALELSFPALQGSSGAPVLSNDNYHLWGIIKGNIDYHLLPVQTIIVRDGETKIEERTDYMCPQGIAIHVKHLREILREIRHPSVKY